MIRPQLAAAFRDAAEARLATRPARTDDADAKLPQLLHELQVHQIELEMQK